MSRAVYFFSYFSTNSINSLASGKSENSIIFLYTWAPETIIVFWFLKKIPIHFASNPIFCIRSLFEKQNGLIPTYSKQSIFTIAK